MGPVAYGEKGKPRDVGKKQLSAQESDGRPNEAALSDTSQEYIELASTLEGKKEDSRQEETYPEGGLRAWLVVLGSWCGLFCALGLLNSLATFQAYLTTHHLIEGDEGKIGWIFSLHTFVAFFCGIYVGPVFDKHGPRWLILAGSLLLCGGLICLSFSMSTFCLLFPGDPNLRELTIDWYIDYWEILLSFGGLCGFAASLLFSPSIAAVGHFFQAKRGAATGIAATGAGLSGVVIPLVMKVLFDRIGWAWAVRTLGLIMLILCVMATFLIRSRLPPLLGARPHPDIRIFKQVPFFLTTLGIFLVEFSIFVPYTYISSYMLAQGFDTGFSYNMLSILNAGGIVGRIAPGYLADRIGSFNCNIMAALLSAVTCLAVWLPAGHTTTGVVVFAALIGFSSGANIMSSPVCVGKLCKTQEYGRYYATTYSVVSFACLISIPIAGEIVEASSGEYQGLIIFNGCTYLGGFVVLMAAKISCVGWNKILGIF